MSNVIERCPNCGVEHELTHKGPCEVCGSDLRFWCQRHSKEIGWLDGPACKRCATEAARVRRAPPSPPVRAPRTRSPVPERRPPRRPASTTARDAAADWLPHVASHGGSLALRLLKAALVIIRSAVVGALILGIVAALYAYQQFGPTGDEGFAIHLLSREFLGTVVLGVVAGGGLGLLWGFIRALRILFATRP